MREAGVGVGSWERVSDSFQLDLRRQQTLQGKKGRRVFLDGAEQKQIA